MNNFMQRKIIYPGQGHVPEYVNGTKVTFHFKTTKSNDKDEEIVIDDSKKVGKPMELIIGKKFKLIIWEELIKVMRVGEVCKIKFDKSLVLDYPFVSKCYRQYAKKSQESDNDDEESHQSHCCGMSMKKLGHEDLDELLEKPQDLEFTIEILKVEPPDKYEKEIWQMDVDEQYNSISKFKEDGNKFYAKQMYKEAADCYFKALGVIEQLILREKPGDEEWNKLDQMKIPLLCNYAQCKLIEKDYYAVIEHTTEVLKRDNDNVKALFRRAKAHSAVWNIDQARDDFNRVIKLDSSLEKVILQEIKQLDIKEKQKNMEFKSKLQGKLFS